MSAFAKPFRFAILERCGAVPLAIRQAEVVAHNLAVEFSGRATKKAWGGGGACFLMTGGTEAAFVRGTWFANPHPDVRFHLPNRVWYMQRVLFEKYQMQHWF